MLSDFELNIYKALDELVGSEKKFKILETEDILNTLRRSNDILFWIFQR